MKQKLKLLPALMALIAGMPAAAQESETPIITFKTSLYDNVGASNAFHFYIGAKEKTYVDVDFGFGPIETEVEPANFNQSTSSIDATLIAGSVNTDGTVKIYGDASLIDYLDLEGVYITDLDISTLTNLEILNLNHNELKALDLTPFSKLQALYISDNPFGTSPLIIGGNKPDLTILDVSIVGSIDPNFDIDMYKSLVSFTGYSTPSLTHITPAGCPDLIQLSIDATSVSNIDVSQNSKLRILNIGETPIDHIDISKNLELTEFYCTHANEKWSDYKYTSLDLSKNTKLKRLMCQGNNLTEIDLSNNPLLQSLYVNGNKLTSIDISKNEYLADVNVSNNYMDFNTLPLPRETFTEYLYYQHDFPVDRSYPVGTTLDFASKVVRPDSETWYALFARRYDENNVGYDVELDQEEYFRAEDGKITLLKSSPDSLYLAFANSLFPEYDIHTSPFMVKEEADFGKDNPAIKFRLRPGASKTVSMAIGMQGATAESPKTFSVDFGDNKPVEFTTSTNLTPEESNASGTIASSSSTITVYTPEGSDISALAIDGVSLSTIDLSGAHCLEELSLTNCRLGSIDLKMNHMLKVLDLSDNNLTSLDLTGFNETYTKQNLNTLKVANNKLTELLPGLGYVAYADLSGNQFSEFNLLKASSVEYLDLSKNSLTEVNLQDLESIKSLNLSNNKLSEILIQDYVTPDLLDLSNNVFPLSKLPVSPDVKTYVYAPQQPWALPAQAPTVNLSKQLLDDKTVFTWYKADGTLIEGDGIRQTNPGIFKLADTSLGKIYCTFTNPAFPDLTGENVYRTTDVEVAEMPTEVICSFRTLTDEIGELSLTASTDNASVYIDWEGNGSLEQYTANLKLTSYEVTTYANADVKIYAYTKEPHISVFSLSTGDLGYIDASPMTELITFSIYGSKLDQANIKLPQAPELEELSIFNGSLTSMDFLKGSYPKLRMINLAENQLTEVDLSEWKQLESIHLDNNKITSTKFDNPTVWNLGISGNELSEIDLSGLPTLLQLYIFDNKLHTLDISGNPALRVLDLSFNDFDFTTLPEVSQSFNIYYYGNQHPITAEVKDGHIVDLSKYGATSFRWFIDSPYLDEDGNLSGEELYVGDEYTIENGVSTFLRNFTHIMCVMQNPEFPNLYLCTDFIDARVESSISEIEASDSAVKGIYDLQGRPVTNPGRGLYIVNGRLEMRR